MGSVEVAPRAGVADAICDLVSNGCHVEANGLRGRRSHFFALKQFLIQRSGEFEP